MCGDGSTVGIAWFDEQRSGFEDDDQSCTVK